MSEQICPWTPETITELLDTLKDIRDALNEIRSRM